MLGVVYWTLCHFIGIINFSSNFPVVREIIVDMDIFVIEVMLFRFSYFMSYYLFINRSKSKTLKTVHLSMC